jgi:predicted Zn-dependent protease
MGAASEISIHGWRGRVASFEADATEGTLRGLVAYVEYSGRVFEILGYSLAGRFGSYEFDFERSIRSFDRLDDPEALSAEPQRVDIVRTDRSMNLAEFASRYGNGADPETLGLINGLDAERSFSSGTWKGLTAGRKVP